MIFFINTLTILFYLFFSILDRWIGVSFPIQIIAIVMLCFVVPYNVYALIPWKFSSRIDRILLYLVFFFFVYVPVWYFLNSFFGILLTQWNIFTANILIFIVSYIALLFWKPDVARVRIPYIPRISDLKNIIKRHSILLVGIVGYGVVHGVNFYFYKFIPEWDSYAYLFELEQIVKTGVLEITYRGFFYVAVTIVSSLGYVDPYVVFMFWFVALQATIVIALYRLARFYNIKHTLLQVVIVLSAVSVPVINMEIAIVRPQSFVLVFFPIYFYFIYRACTQKEVLSWVASSLIVLGGLNYHEFFVFIFLVHISILVIGIFYQYVIYAKCARDRSIFFLGVTSLIFITLYFKDNIRFIRFTIRTAGTVSARLLSSITDLSQWRWWFLGQYQTDGEALQMGWSGIDGVIKYYAYSASPYALFFIAFLVTLIWKKYLPYKDKLLLVLLFLFVPFFMFAEVLPRINFFLLPERFWIFITLLLIIASVPLWAAAEKVIRFSRLKIIASIACVSIIIGIGGSWYIASGKGTLVSVNEHQAAQWIEKYTDPEAVFFSQAGNTPMIIYFARRIIVHPEEHFFLSDEIDFIDSSKRKEDLLQKIKDEEEKIDDYLQRSRGYDHQNIAELIDLISEKIDKIEKIKEDIARIDRDEAMYKDKDMYILYSEDKFKTLYADREWWLRSNFYGANLDKFHEAYPLVYSEDEIHIWKIE